AGGAGGKGERPPHRGDGRPGEGTQPLTLDAGDAKEVRAIEFMIAIRKPSPGPAVLRDRGRQAAAELARLYDSASADYDSGMQTFDFDQDIYAHGSVKEALRRAQHDKCAFCESKMCHTGFGDVEHYRPKAGYKQREGDALGRPGYYWLAYEWSNLLLSCQL